MKTTIIISVYKNIKALEVIINALNNQTNKVDEIIISEDGEFPEMKKFLENLNNDKITHLTQEDLGWRKNRALNRAIQASSGEYLIFIDGDVVPHNRFIEGHLHCSKQNRVCAGKRTELGQQYSQMLFDKKISIKQLTKNYLLWIIQLHKDKIRHYEDGIYVKPSSWIYNKIIQKKHINYLIGCNFSCYKNDIESINGFDEDYVNPAIGEDVDINWRFRGNGIEVISCRNIANVYHLWHKKGFGENEGEINNKILSNTIKNNQVVCLNGIKKLKKEEH